VKCFYHSNTDAVGVCKYCQKGICINCIADLDGGIACKGKCESQVLLLSALIKRNAATYERSNAINKKGAQLFLGMGIFFLIFGFIEICSSRNLLSAAMPLGLGIFCSSIGWVYSSKNK